MLVLRRLLHYCHYNFRGCALQLNLGEADQVTFCTTSDCKVRQCTCCTTKRSAMIGFAKVRWEKMMLILQFAFIMVDRLTLQTTIEPVNAIVYPGRILFLIPLNMAHIKDYRSQVSSLIRVEPNVSPANFPHWLCPATGNIVFLQSTPNCIHCE